MRYLGNKSKLIHFIDYVIDKYKIEGETFADLFAGTCSVGDYFKDRYRIIANDYMYFSKIISDAKLLNSKVPNFKIFRKEYGVSPIDYLNNKEYKAKENYFVYKNYTPEGNRMYLTESNGIRIDGNRIDIEEFYKQNLLDYKEYCFLLASLIGSVLKVSNTSGTYQAFFKFWEPRSQKKFKIEPLEINEVEIYSNDNITYSENTNKLVRKIEGDIVYLDPPYTITQYTNSYHVLETVAKYDYPEIFGKTGRRVNRELSMYSNKTHALKEFEDLFRQINFKHVLLSYSNQSIIKIDDMIDLVKKFAKNGKVYIESSEYREYATNNLSKKGNNLKEYLIYFEKDLDINKSPLNYSGSKDKVANKIFKHLPKKVDVFVDAMGGAFNIGANVIANEKVIYNEYNPFIFGIMEMLINKKSKELILEVENIIDRFELKKKNKDNYIKFRDYYNRVDKSSINLYVLQIYAFQNMIRFNNSLEMNTPVGNNEFSDSIKERLINFKVKSEKVELYNLSYEQLNIDNLPKDTVFYFDPPYFITRAEYNDGKRGLKGWDADKETELLNYLTQLDSKGFKFMLSNVLYHNGKAHNILLKWLETNNYNVYEIGVTGIKYPRKEVLITNY